MKVRKWTDDNVDKLKRLHRAGASAVRAAAALKCSRAALLKKANELGLAFTGVYKKRRQQKEAEARAKGDYQSVSS